MAEHLEVPRPLRLLLTAGWRGRRAATAGPAAWSICAGDVHRVGHDLRDEQFGALSGGDTPQSQSTCRGMKAGARHGAGERAQLQEAPQRPPAVTSSPCGSAIGGIRTAVPGGRTA